jgi:hypothetical protein
MTQVEIFAAPVVPFATKAPAPGTFTSTADDSTSTDMSTRKSMADRVTKSGTFALS